MFENKKVNRYDQQYNQPLPQKTSKLLNTDMSTTQTDKHLSPSYVHNHLVALHRLMGSQ